MTSRAHHLLSGPEAELVVEEHGDSGSNEPPILWLHCELGSFDDPPFPADLIGRRRILAFHHPGWGVATGPDAFKTIPDIATAYLWALDNLGGRREVVMVGHGIGATIGLEMAIQQPDRFIQVFAACPFGLWDDAIPGADLFALLAHDARRHLYADPEGDVAGRHFPRAKDAHQKGKVAIQRAQTLGAASRYLFPIPDTGISSRLYRLRDSAIHFTWGEEDGITLPALLEHWVKHLPQAETTVFQDASHMHPYETPAFGELIAAPVS
jgi:pimeloyl-ACP methyl ester carboxylesterase